MCVTQSNSLSLESRILPVARSRNADGCRDQPLSEFGSEGHMVIRPILNNRRNTSQDSAAITADGRCAFGYFLFFRAAEISRSCPNLRTSNWSHRRNFNTSVGYELDISRTARLFSPVFNDGWIYSGVRP